MTTAGYTCLRGQVKITLFFLEMTNSQVGFVAEGAESGTPFPDIDLSTKVSVTPFTLHHHILLLLRLHTA